MTKLRKQSKCPMTVSGKHQWREFFDGIDAKKTAVENKKLHDKGYIDSFLWVPKIIIKCNGCGLINDTK